MTVKELLDELYKELALRERLTSIYRTEYFNCEKYEMRESIEYAYARYTNSINMYENLRSAISIIERTIDKHSKINKEN